MFAWPRAFDTAFNGYSFKEIVVKYAESRASLLDESPVPATLAESADVLRSSDSREYRLGSGKYIRLTQAFAF